MSSSIRRRVLALASLAYEVRAPVVSLKQASIQTHDEFPGHESQSDSSITFWNLGKIKLRTGWYMLEVEHSPASIGCTLTIERQTSPPEHLQLTSKRVCKRIIRWESGAGRCTVSIDQPDCSLGQFTLVALSSRFSAERMRSRLVNRGYQVATGVSDAKKLYADYQTHLHEAFSPKQYRAEMPDDVAENYSLDQGALIKTARLVLQSRSGVNCSVIDSSVEAAMKFARQLGWKVDWQQDIESDLDSGCVESASRVFIMPIQADVHYRIDVFHELMSGIKQGSVLVYADHDHIDPNDIHSAPVLKPEWNPELLLNMNYIQLPWIVCQTWSSSVLDDAGTVADNRDQVLLAASLGIGTRSLFVSDESDAKASRGQSIETDLNELDVSVLGDHQVQRIPRVLASLRVPETMETGRLAANTKQWSRAVYCALSRAGSRASLVDAEQGTVNRIKWHLPEKLPSVDIIIPTQDNVSVLKKCIDSVFQKTIYSNYRLIIVDNDSEQEETHAYYSLLESDSRCSLLHFPGEFNYSAINNFAVAHSQAQLLVLLNNDTEVISPEWLEELISQAIRPEIGCVGAKLYYSNGRIQHGGVIVGTTGVARHAHRYSPGHAVGYCDRMVASQNFTAVTAACLAVRRATYLQAGGLDQDELAVAWNDVDFCLKLRKLGYQNVWTPHARLFHHEGLTRGADDTRQKINRVDAERRVMIDRWALDTFADPAYHPLLTRDGENFSLGKTIS